MTATLTLTLDKATYNKGDTITATYAVTNDTVPPVVANEPITGSATIDGTPVTFAGTVAVSSPGVHAHTFNPPLLNGVAFKATANPIVWTGTAA